MAETKKFLDQEGVSHLWSKIVEQDYTNNQLLMTVIDAIDEEKADRSEIPSTDNFATKVYVANKIAEAQLDGDGNANIDLSGYATKDDISNLRRQLEEQARVKIITWEADD